MKVTVESSGFLAICDSSARIELTEGVSRAYFVRKIICSAAANLIKKKEKGSLLVGSYYHRAPTVLKL